MSERITSEDARALRRGRQRFAAPGGFHDRLVRVLAAVLPMGVGVLAALMIITPLAPRGEVSFLLDRDEVAVIDERLRVDNAMVRGSDSQGRPFSLTADEAVQRSTKEGILRLDDMVARIQLPEGPASLRAPNGRYLIRDDVVDVDGTLRLTAADGYRLAANGVSIDLDARELVGSGGVSGEIPAGTFSADALRIDLPERTVTLTGNARMRMEPGALRSMQ
ncbi:LPS export ABC transporter periplasmic protein LptC [Qipengyuania sp. DSG2-2]|uniref:LPS export ABC transporter periplasmic protein LptC n=1 Tax=Qipengyuania sp. DGS2-2 TaxID=3349631 RepID=UPI0036D35CA9